MQQAVKFITKFLEKIYLKTTFSQVTTNSVKFSKVTAVDGNVHNLNLKLHILLKSIIDNVKKSLKPADRTKKIIKPNFVL